MALEDKIRRELLAARKAAHGLTLSTMTASPVLCAVLGDGNPAVALNALKVALLRDHDGSLAISAAAASLGFASTEPTHLGRLDDFGLDYGLDQRQVRRYSDRGVASLASMISRHWAAETVPRLDIVLSRPSDDHWHMHARAATLVYVEMREITLVVVKEDREADVDLQWRERSREHWRYLELQDEVTIPVSSIVVLVFQWKGEIWPKFRSSALGTGFAQIFSHESVGNKLQIELQAL